MGITVSPHFFNLEDNTQSIEIVSHAPEKCTLQWYLYNPSGNLQAQCFLTEGGRRTTVIAPGTSAAYGVSGEKPAAGQWTLWVVCLSYAAMRQESAAWSLDIACGTGAGKVPEEKPSFTWMDSEGKLSGEYLKRNYDTAMSWYGGDFHIHTDCSDGKMPPSRIKREAERLGLHFFAITEHNFFHTGWIDDSRPVIPGMELTLEQGHFNIFAPSALPMSREDFWHEISPGELPEILLKKFHESGAVISVNHPFMSPWEVRDPGLDISMLDAMEIICDPTWNTSSDSAEKALKAFGILWDHGIRVTGIGGSDIHNPPEVCYDGSDTPGRIGFPTTWVLSGGLSVSSLLEALKEQNVYVSEGFMLDVSAVCPEGIYPIGSRLPDVNQGEIRFEIRLTDKGANMPYPLKSYRIEIVENGGVKESADIGNEGRLGFTRRWDNGYHWLRIDIRDEAGRLCGFTNPFYKGVREKEKMTWGKLLELTGKT